MREIGAQYPPSRQDGRHGQDLEIVLQGFPQKAPEKMYFKSQRLARMSKWESQNCDQNLLQGRLSLGHCNAL